ncbi:Metallo-dependent phosphatase-like protein [Cokeromyces recurvatus]|uniref:Metallo-dependent phosphatase-like protein n=1 Tax=Cokeromyces recurvatus TaxID=90255 RepID=UPI00221FC7CB|nr:Metallo-dependent phosphatase-like protein [Cokeromyces recurvatus]KAI7898859.1 Metallo-dependent phosphatase-like protein [Cokeromyces recurvatus]
MTTATTEDIKVKAEEIKNEANAYFKDKHFTAAIEKYTEAIELNPQVASYYTNRAFCHIKLESYGYAIADSNKALEIDPHFTKGNYRRASANMALGNFKAALKDLRIVSKRAPNDKDAKAKFEECQKIVRRIEFENAIKDDQKQSVASKLDIDAIVVDDSYKGPRINEETKTIDQAFVKDMIKHFKDQKKIHKKYAFMIILAIRKYMMEAPTLVDVEIPADGKLTVCGDVHGQFYDFINIFDTNGYPSEKHAYLFNGDFVDRGSFSVEVILTLFAYKWLYPNHLFLARGNHETDNMNKVYGFEGEVKAKFSEMMFSLFSETFNALPLCHLIKNKIFVTHGGLFSRDNVTLDEIRKIDRIGQGQPGSEGLMCELLWSDPQPEPGRSTSKRGVGIQFGPDVTKNFLETNNLEMIIRSHEVKEEGYVIEHDGKCVTVFSAPNYCDTVGNKGALINMTPDLKKEYITFTAVVSYTETII